MKKNHKMVNEKLLQTNKTWSHLKLRQKEKISEWMYEEYSRAYDKAGHPPQKEQHDDIISAVYARIEAAEIWIPYPEVRTHYFSRLSKIRKRCLRQHGVTEDG